MTHCPVAARRHLRPAPRHVWRLPPGTGLHGGRDRPRRPWRGTARRSGPPCGGSGRGHAFHPGTTSSGGRTSPSAEAEAHRVVAHEPVAAPRSPARAAPPARSAVLRARRPALRRQGPRGCPCAPRRRRAPRAPRRSASSRRPAGPGGPAGPHPGRPLVVAPPPAGAHPAPVHRDVGGEQRQRLHGIQLRHEEGGDVPVAPLLRAAPSGRATARGARAPATAGRRSPPPAPALRSVRRAQASRARSAASAISADRSTSPTEQPVQRRVDRLPDARRGTAPATATFHVSGTARATSRGEKP